VTGGNGTPAIRQRLRVLARYVWASPNTLLGLGIGAIAVALGARLHAVAGNLEIGGGLLGRGVARLPAALRFSAITFGHVILATSRDVLPTLRDHECVHVRQYERWGILFIPAYLASSLWQLLHGRSPYWANHFEKQAFSAAPDEPRSHVGP